MKGQSVAYISFPRERGHATHRVTWGSARFGQEAERSEGKAQARALIGVSTGKARQGRVTVFGLASCSSLGRRWGLQGSPG